MGTIVRLLPLHLNGMSLAIIDEPHVHLMATTPQQSDPQADPSQPEPAQSPSNGASINGNAPVQPRPPATPSSGDSPTLPPAHRYDSSMGALRAFLFGQPLRSAMSGHQKLPKILALPIFSSDALSSVAYATEAILGTLILVGTGSLGQAMPIAIAICSLICIVALSYRQIIFAYPNGGGAYPVGKENLGTIYALIAGASLLVDYILTVAVSVASGIDAIGSFSSATVGWLHETGFWVHAHTVEVCLLATLVVMLANLRGVKESGAIFAVPAYAFILSFVVMIIVGFVDLATGHIHQVTKVMLDQKAISYGFQASTTMAGTYLVLQAFSSGCSALTGMEAISNTTPFFRPPQDRNAAATMSWMAGIAIVFFFGITYLAHVIGAIPIDSTAANYQTVISEIAHEIFDSTPFAWFYYLVQISTAIILILAANTAFSGFPQLSSMLAKDRFLPRQLASMGDRLVYMNGIVLLGLTSCALLVIFGGNVYELIPLYAVGVFTSFTIAQSGMVVHWLRAKTPGWRYSIVLNAVGAVATAAVALIFVVSKWASGVAISDRLTIPTDGIYRISLHGFHHYSLDVYRNWQHTHVNPPADGFNIGPDLVPHYGAWIVALLIPMLVMMFYSINAHYVDAERQLTLPDPDLATAQRVQPTVLVLIPRLHRGVLEALRYAQSISKDTRALYVEIDENNTAKLKEQWESYAQGSPLVILASPYRSLFGPILRYVDAVLRDQPDQKLTIVVPEFVSVKWWHNILHNNSGLLLKYILSGKRGVIVTNVRYFLD